MSFRYRTSNVPVSGAAFENVEAALGAKLPTDYVQFISQANGGSVDFSNKYVYALPPEFPDDVLQLEQFFPLEEALSQFDRFKRNFKIELLPIGLDDFGNYICLSLQAADFNAVYFVDHELTDEETGRNLVIKLATNFGGFVQLLGSEES